MLLLLLLLLLLFIFVDIASGAPSFDQHGMVRSFMSRKTTFLDIFGQLGNLQH